MYSQDSEFFTARPDTIEEKAVYFYIRRLAQDVEPELAKKWFYHLLHQGATLPTLDPKQTVAQSLKAMLVIKTNDSQTLHALHPPLKSDGINDSLLFFINRCFYTIGNRWRLDSTKHKTLSDLISQIHQYPRHEPKSRELRRLRQVVEKYSQQEQFYLPLQRQMLLLSNQETDHQIGPSTCFRDCFKQYFFLYEAGAATPDIPRVDRESLRLQQAQVAHKLTKGLETFWHNHPSPNQSKSVNPTRIPDPQLKDLIWLCSPNRANSYHYQASTFDQQHQKIRTNQELCDQLFEYVMAPIIEHDLNYRHNRFNHMVRETLQQCIRGEESAPVNAIIITQMCIRLLKRLVCNTLTEPKWTYFKYMIDKLGHQVVTAVLLKILLFRRTIRPWFENRFGILFHHWESHSIQEVPWLVQAFEYMNVALALNSTGMYCFPGKA